MKRLKDRVVLITGASAGIGEACATAFASEGADLILTARREDRLKTLAAKLAGEYKVNVIYRALDVRDRNAVKSVLDSLDGRWRDIDILINNAGLALGVDKFHESSMDEWDAVIDTNIKGAFICARLVLENMLKRNCGHIINLGSAAGREVYPGGSVYCATKHAINAFTRALRLDLCGKKIRVSSVDPGMVETDFSVVRFRGDSGRAKKVYENMTPLTAADVADAILFCATRPAHVNINELSLMPVDQASTTMVSRKTSE